MQIGKIENIERSSDIETGKKQNHTDPVLY